MPISTQAGNNHASSRTPTTRADYGRCDQNVTNSFNGFITYDLRFAAAVLFGGNIPAPPSSVVWGLAGQLHPPVPQRLSPSRRRRLRRLWYQLRLPRADCDGSGRNPPATVDLPQQPQLNLVQLQARSRDRAAGTSVTARSALHRSPGCKAVDFASPSYHDFEHQDLRVPRAEAINVLNHPILVAPNSSHR